MKIKRFWSGMAQRVGLKTTDKLIVGNVDTGSAEFVDISALLDLLELSGGGYSTPEAVRDALSSLSGVNRLAVTAILNAVSQTELNDGLAARVPKSAIVALTSASTVTWDVAGVDNKQATLALSHTTCTFDVDNLADGDTELVRITPQSVADYTITFTASDTEGGALTCTVGGEASAELVLSTDDSYRIYISRMGSAVDIIPDSRAY
ncbi:hypothetical protein [Roseivirga sp. UBA838]|uniref:hypothetical protein n=1 Tax=Roseivirga sp. UBA838 TaxID=1947393 RepID=UPI00257E4350|nr:hypothetical protein [Roseivirga sp. UBA838]|tara:strand:+ start:2448 stop:3068 length:621 start_codon:yes stop_codon:yes gene_type:complete